MFLDVRLPDGQRARCSSCHWRPLAAGSHHHHGRRGPRRGGNRRSTAGPGTTEKPESLSEIKLPLTEPCNTGKHGRKRGPAIDETRRHRRQQPRPEIMHIEQASEAAVMEANVLLQARPARGKTSGPGHPQEQLQGPRELRCRRLRSAPRHTGRAFSSQRRSAFTAGRRADPTGRRRNAFPGRGGRTALNSRRHFYGSSKGTGSEPSATRRKPSSPPHYYEPQPGGHGDETAVPRRPLFPDSDHDHCAAALRERPEDIRETAAYHVARLVSSGSGKRKFAEVLDVLLKHRWAGNVRELVHTLERSIAAAFHEPVLSIKHLPIAIRVEVKKNAVMESRKGIPSRSARDIHPGDRPVGRMPKHPSCLPKRSTWRISCRLRGRIKVARSPGFPDRDSTAS